MRQITWLAFQDRLDKISLRLDEADKRVQNTPLPGERPLPDSGKPGIQPKGPTKNNQTAASKKMESGASTAQPAIEKQPGAGTDEAAREQARENVNINRQLAQYTGDLARLTKWLVVATLAGSGVLFIAAVYQAWITRRANSLTLRAWLTVESIDLFPNPIGQAELYVKVTARNIGKLPATSVTAILLPQIDRYIDPLPFAQHREIHFVIAAGHSETFPFMIKNFPAAHIERLRGGTFGLRVIADLRYTDALVTRGHTIQHARYLHARPEEALPERLFLDPDGAKMD